MPGLDYSHDEVVNRLIDNPENRCVVLYPGTDAINLFNKKTIHFAQKGNKWLFLSLMAHGQLHVEQCLLISSSLILKPQTA